MYKDILLFFALSRLKGFDMNKNLYRMDVVAEQQAQEQAMREAYDISDLPDDDDYGDDDFEGTGSSNTNVTVKKPNKPNRPSGAGRGGRSTSSASSSSSRGGRPSGRPSGRPGGARPTRGGRS